VREVDAHGFDELGEASEERRDAAHACYQADGAANSVQHIGIEQQPQTHAATEDAAADKADA
jgi:hypothetical protein